MSTRHIPSRCGACRGEHIVMKRVWWKVVAGVLITLLCTALALPTLGVSVVPMIWGIFLILKRPRCQDCGWEP